MALTNQPYLPLYIQDWLTNNKLKQCLLGAHGLMINVMCLMHKEDTYGKLLLRQKFKQTDKQQKNFALMLAKLLPFDLPEIEKYLSELIDEKVLIIQDDLLICKRMVKDAETSAVRSLSGKKGGEKTKEKILKPPNNFAQAKVVANTENEIEYENNNNYSTGLVIEMAKIFKKYNPIIEIIPTLHYPPCLQIAYRIAKLKGWQQADVLNGKMPDTLKSWEKIVEFTKTEDYLASRSIIDLNNQKEWDRLLNKMQLAKTPIKKQEVTGSPIKKESETDFDKYKTRK